MKAVYGMLGRYIMRRFLLAIMGAFTVCATLIIMIDLVELLRLSGRSGNVPSLSIALIAILRLASHAEVLLPFCVLVGSSVALLMLNRSSELAVMRAAGISAWQFLWPGIVLAFVLGVISTLAFNPLSAATRQTADRMFAELYGREATGLTGGASGNWLRQEGPDGSSVMSVAAAARDGLEVFAATFVVFDRQGRLVERVEARRAVLNAGYWLLEDARIARLGRPPETVVGYRIATYLTPDRIADALGAAASQSVFELPSLIRLAEQSGISAAHFRVQLDLLISRPALLVAMVLLAGSVSLRSFRSGRLQTMVIAGVIGGLGFLLFSEVSRQIGAAGLAPSAMAVWVPVLVAMCGSLTVLLHQEDG